MSDNLNSISKINNLVKMGFSINNIEFVPYAYILPLLYSGLTLYKVSPKFTISTIKLENNRIKEEKKYTIRRGTPVKVRSHNPILSDFIKNQIGLSSSMDNSQQTRYYITLPTDLNVYTVYKDFINGKK